jgi:hypothetical protein
MFADTVSFKDLSRDICERLHVRPVVEQSDANCQNRDTLDEKYVQWLLDGPNRFIVRTVGNK